MRLVSPASRPRHAIARPKHPRRSSTIAIAISLGVFLATGLSGAAATSNTTNVTITPVAPVHTVTAGASIAANKTYSFVASGGATTVPTQATVVQLAVTVKGTAAGTLTFYPSGDPGSVSPNTLSWAAAGTNSGSVNVNIGLSNKVVINNASAAAATITVKITGYSTQVTNGTVNGSGGTVGQALINNGNGTTSWKTPGAGYDTTSFTSSGLNSSAYTTVDSVTVPAGSYVLGFSATLVGSSSSPEDPVVCVLRSPAGNTVAAGYGNTSASNSQNMLALQGAMSTGGGTIIASCLDNLSTTTVFDPSLTAIKVGTLNGATVFGAANAPAPHAALAP